MRTGVTLADLRNEVLIEAGLSTEAGHASFSRERLNQMINRTQRMMGITEDWPSNQFEEEVTVTANAQYANLPSNINFTMIDTVHVSFGSEWLPVEHGITAEDRSIWTDAQRSTPIRKWEIQAPGNVNFEVWPRGAVEQTLLFEGAKSFAAMTDDTDTCVLDADVITLRVAAHIAGRDRKEDAELMLRQAVALTDAIIKRQGSVKRGDVALGRRSRKRLRSGIDYIPSGVSI